MYNKLLFVVLIFSFTNICSQEKDFPDLIDQKAILLKNTAGKIYNLGSKTDLIRAFGKAKMTKHFDETVSESYYEYDYKGLIIYFYDGDDFTTDISLKTPRYQFIMNGKSYKVGDKISLLSKEFPASFRVREKRSISDTGIRIQIGDKKLVSDVFIYIVYNSAGIIKEISMEFNRS